MYSLCHSVVHWFPQSDHASLRFQHPSSTTQHFELMGAIYMSPYDELIAAALEQ